MSCDLALPVAVLFNSLDDLIVTFVCIVPNPLREDRIERGPIGEALAFGDLRNMGESIGDVELIRGRCVLNGLIEIL